MTFTPIIWGSFGLPSIKRTWRFLPVKQRFFGLPPQPTVSM